MKKVAETVKKNRKTKVLLVYTGGTIGMMQDPTSKELKPFNFKHLSEQIPELSRLNVKLSSVSFEKPIDSSNMSPEVWTKLVRLIEKNYDTYDGFVILHGSDTMSYTACALSFMLENLNKPVILTGSQLPIGIIRTDGKENLITAIEIAASRNEEGGPTVPEVAIYFEYRLYRGNRTHKHNAEHFQAFQSANYPTLAEAGVHIKFNHGAIAPYEEKKLRAHFKLNTNVGILKIFPGITRSFVESVLNAKGLEGLVIETFGAGNAPTDEWFVEALKKAIKNGLIIVNITQCNAGTVEQGKYETSAQLKSAGVISGGDMTTEAAITKLMYMLASSDSKKEIKKQIEIPLRGELTIN